MKNVRIAIIEDHDLNDECLREALGKRDRFEIVGEASDGIHGLALLESTRPDVAIVDVVLPDIDGIEVVRRFRQIQTQSEKLETKIVMLTTRKVQDTMLEAFAAGADSYCIKDSLDKLEEAIRLTHEGNPWIDPSIATVVATQVRQPDQDIEEQNVSTAWLKKLEQEYKDVFLNAGITDPEIEIFLLIVQGYDNVEIACKLNMTVDEAETCIRHICDKFHASFCETSYSG